MLWVVVFRLGKPDAVYALAGASLPPESHNPLGFGFASPLVCREPQCFSFQEGFDSGLRRKV